MKNYFELKNGMVVEIKWSALPMKKYIVMGNRLLGETGYVDLSSVTADMEVIANYSYITRVFEQDRALDMDDVFNKEEKLTLIWERNYATDWSKVKKYTKVQVKDDYQTDWKNRYFLEEKGGTFFATGLKEDTFSNMGGNEYAWDQCRLYKEGKVI